MSVLVTTVPGLEDYVVMEAEERMGTEVGHVYDRMSGRVLLETGFSSVMEAKSFLASMRTIENAYYLLDSGEVGPLMEDLEGRARALRLEGLMGIVTPETSVAVEAVRAGDQEYSSTDVARAVGDAVISFLEGRGVKALVNLSSPDVVIGAHVLGRGFMVGVKITRSTARDREYRVRGHPASLNPVIAFSMIMMASPDEGDTLCDLTCGGGTIPAEAAHFWRRIRSVCIDVNPDYCDSAGSNLAAAGGDFDLAVGDSTTPMLRPLSCDHVVFNPPYGIRMKTEKPIRAFYKELMANALRAARKSIVVITGRRRLVTGALGSGASVSERRVEQGGMYSSIFIIRKKMSF